MPPAKMSHPSLVAWRVSDVRTHCWANICIQEPTMETDSPAMYRANGPRESSRVNACRLDSAAGGEVEAVVSAASVFTRWGGHESTKELTLKRSLHTCVSNNCLKRAFAD